MATLPSEADVLAYHEKLSNWGRWGADDQLGTLNLVTPEVRRRAAGLVTEGTTVSVSWDLSTMPQEGDVFGPVHRFMVMTGEGLGDPNRVVPPHPVPGVDSTRFAGAAEYMGFVFHGVNVTHVDALSHVFWDRQTYNGGAAELVNTMFGATNLAVTGMSEGIVSRGILVDVPAARGVDWLEPGDGVGPDDLDAAEAHHGVRVDERRRRAAPHRVRAAQARGRSHPDARRAGGLARGRRCRGCTSAASPRSAVTPRRTSSRRATRRCRSPSTSSAWSRWACASSTTATSRSSRRRARGCRATSSCSPSPRSG